MASAADLRPDPERVLRLFHEAAALPLSERIAFVDRAAHGDTPLRDAVSSLLAALSEPSTIWNYSALELEARHSAFDTRTAHPGEFFGPYRMLRRIATGGMGVVFEAFRDDSEFHKRVAIKFVYQGLDDAAGVDRFRTERQILARLEHAGIARLLDGGTTADGLPYLVMEYVDGVPIDQFAAQRRLSRTDRLRLWLQVAEAVQYAHRNLVVHRDLKPGNILVTADGIPKLLDFGIAKLLGGDSGGTTVQALTPEYASPEQVSGGAIGTATDVYSLGVLLFLLLAGRLPYDSTAANPADLMQAICEQDPAWDPPGLIDTDLHSVLALAMRKEPERRYLSVEQFAGDVQRYLAGLPVSARGDSLLYRARKLIVRRALPLGAVAALFIAVVSGLSASLWQAQRAERQRQIAQRRFDDARRLAYSVIHDIQPKLAAINGTVVLRKTLIEQTAVYLEALAKDAGDSPALMRELIDSYVALAQVAADAGTANVGDLRGAADILQKAETLARTLALRDGSTPASAHSLIGFYRASARYSTFYGLKQKAEASARQALAIAERLAAARPGDLSAQDDVAGSAMTLADATSDLISDPAGHQDMRIALYERALAVWRDVLQRDPGNADRWKKRIALSCKNLSGALLDTNVPRSLEYAMQAQEIDREFLDRDPSSPAAQMDLAFDIGAIGRAWYILRDYPKAAASMRENVALREKVAAANPDDRRAADRLAYALRDLAQTEALLGDRAAARRDLLRTARLYTRLSQTGTLNPQSLYRFAQTAQDLAEAKGGAEACQWLVKSMELLNQYERRQTLPADASGEIASIRRNALRVAALQGCGN